MTETYLRNELSAFEKRIAYRFGDMGLLEQALTPSSLRDTQIPTNERLEFLGDAILGQVMSEHLFGRFLDFDEGDLTRIKSVVVSARNLAQKAREMGFGDAVRVGKGLRKNPLPDSLLADALEAVIAAIYLDGGMDESISRVDSHGQDRVFARRPLLSNSVPDIPAAGTRLAPRIAGRRGLSLSGSHCQRSRVASHGCRVPSHPESSPPAVQLHAGLAG